jgi:hypothetical protein
MNNKHTYNKVYEVEDDVTVITYQILWEIREEYERKCHKFGPTDSLFIVGIITQVTWT